MICQKNSRDRIFEKFQEQMNNPLCQYPPEKSRRGRLRENNERFRFGFRGSPR